MVHPYAIIMRREEKVISDIIWEIRLTMSKKGMPCPFEEYMRRWMTFQKRFASWKKRAKMMMKKGECVSSNCFYFCTQV